MTLKDRIDSLREEIKRLEKEASLEKKKILDAELPIKMGKLYENVFALTHVHEIAIPFQVTDHVMVDFRTFEFNQIDEAIVFTGKILDEYL